MTVITRGADGKWPRKQKSYQPRSIKRSRTTKDEVEARQEALLNIIEEMQPMTVRQVFYQATVHGLVEKTEKGYHVVQRDLTVMRRDKETLPYEWIVDNTRGRNHPQTYDGIQEALNDTARFYRKSLWTEADCYVEIWLEKDALAGVVDPITDEYDVSLMVARGYASLSFLHEAAVYISDLYVPTYIYHLGDFDPSGVNAGESIEQSLRDMAPDAEIHFKRLAVTEGQIKRWKLPTRPSKEGDVRTKKHGKISCELDAIAPDQLRNLVKTAIEQHLPPAEFEILKVAEQSEREMIGGLVGMWKRSLREEDQS
jgi:hypothetical protein